MFSYPVNLNWIQGFVVSVARLVIWAGAMCGVCWSQGFSKLKAFPLGPEKADTPGLG